ncbi:hypothetical protein [Rhizobium sp.]
MSKLVRYEIDLANPPPLTASQEAELAALAAMPYEQIDYSDIPPIADSFWKKAVRNPYLQREKDRR